MRVASCDQLLRTRYFHSRKSSHFDQVLNQISDFIASPLIGSLAKNAENLHLDYANINLFYSIRIMQIGEIGFQL